MPYTGFTIRKEYEKFIKPFSKENKHLISLFSPFVGYFNL